MSGCRGTDNAECGECSTCKTGVLSKCHRYQDNICYDIIVSVQNLDTRKPLKKGATDKQINSYAQSLRDIVVNRNVGDQKPKLASQLYRKDYSSSECDNKNCG